ncbi:hypothetical protein TBKG_02960 [Mycobacterium tuberculosis '98-R604 INH-RIF-EM']|uniref:Uncharacterized protein n=1 Tax=Mycobacterium tuberculosis (strain CDC 1551 / Oshkosh) TaxID=83331 RepID=Q8VK07_MYCTO|nr:hypothetical protein MT1560.1 [Mycobacterium tuberculosis CDC1551]ABR05887.1 hypothetical protein TBFG_11544 [Mycobacterium tuberculosis F11]ACT25540.1 conserved hypothetical protein [Mycobacterium tuberculosis KZN 1435]AGV30675.1 hypothetical protein TBHG_03993 [Mycobacterium tuberculosis str. Haarlem]EFD13122.1 conserved hypothetical protein [Mycobacterium tuberculosis T46]EFD46943.1 conserved hypothetical protein [Mycobacterium tuberculosis T17]EFD53282.1 conserved hypothetical protein 
MPQVDKSRRLVSEHSVLGSDPSRRRCNLIWLKLVRTEGRAHRRVATVTCVTAPGDTRCPGSQRQLSDLWFCSQVGRGCAGLEVAWGSRRMDSPPRFRAKRPQAQWSPTWPRWSLASHFPGRPRQPGGRCRTGVPYPHLL